MERTLADLQKRVASRINQVSVAGELSPGFIQSAEITRWINDGKDVLVEKVAHMTRDFFTQEAKADLVANQAEYEIYSAAMTDKLFITDVYIKYSSSGDYQEATRASFREIKSELVDGSTTNPYWAYITKDISGKNKLHMFLDPTPSDNVTEGLQIFYAEYLPDLAESSDTLDLPVRSMFEWVERYTALQAFDKMENDTMMARTEQKLSGLEVTFRSAFQPRKFTKPRAVVPTAAAKRQYAKKRGWI